MFLEDSIPPVCLLDGDLIVIERALIDFFVINLTMPIRYRLGNLQPTCSSPVGVSSHCLRRGQ